MNINITIFTYRYNYTSHTEIVVAEAGAVDSQLVEHGNHLLALGEGAHWTGEENVT